MPNINQPLFGVKATSNATDQLMSATTEQTITSLEVAELMGKRHDHIMRDIRNILSQLDEISRPNFGSSTYTSDRGMDFQAFQNGKVVGINNLQNGISIHS